MVNKATMPYDEIESLVEGVGSLEMSFISFRNVENKSRPGPMNCRPPHHPHTRQFPPERNSSNAQEFHMGHVMKTRYSLSGSTASRRTYKMTSLVMYQDGEDSRVKGGKELSESTQYGYLEVKEDAREQPIASGSKSKDYIHQPIHCNSHGFLESTNFSSTPVKSGAKYCPSPQGSFYSAPQYLEARQSFSNTEVSGHASSPEATNSCDLVESQKTSIYRGSTGSEVSDESSSTSFSSATYKPHKANDTRWLAIRAVRARNNGVLELKNFRIFKRLGGGDIGTVHLAELIGNRTLFAVKVMDKDVLVHRKKILRAQAEREILQSLDHPFLPTLYSHFETEKFSCLVIEFCPGGDLHSLRQKQPGKFFPEHAARFYLAEVLLALEYLHMLGIIYRDLKPENVLVREDGHIMLSDFDLSLRCASSPTLVKSSNPNSELNNSSHCVQPACMEPSCVVQTSCIQPTCFSPHFLVGKPKKDKSYRSRPKSEIHNLSMLPELRAEPTNARSMSFVGTHEYLAPEIIKGEGHGSAVDWWTFGIFLYELLFGRTPFRGAANRATLFNVVGQPLRFPDSPTVSFAARDLIRGLLVKEPQHRLAYRRGASEIKQHPFFQNVNWALIRCATPPEVPPPFNMNDTEAPPPEVQKVEVVDVKPAGNYYEIDFF